MKYHFIRNDKDLKQVRKQSHTYRAMIRRRAAIYANNGKVAAHGMR